MLDIITLEKFTILSFGKDLNIVQIKKILVNIVNYQMSFKSTFTKLCLALWSLLLLIKLKYNWNIILIIMIKKHVRVFNFVIKNL